MPGFVSHAQFVAAQLLGKTTRTSMSSFALTELPNEILSLIAVFSMPDGYQSLRSTCKEMHAICQRYMHSHHRLCMYECWTMTRGRFADKVQDAQIKLAPAVPSPSVHRLPIWHLLRQIARAPIVARYIWYLNLSDPYSSEPIAPQRSLGDIKKFFTKADLRILRDLMNKSPAFSANGLTTDHWWYRLSLEMRGRDYLCTHLESPSSMVATVLALSLLPNLKELRLSERWNRDQRHGIENSVVPLLKAIVDRANTGHPAAGLRALETIRPQTDSVVPCRYALADLTSFLKPRTLTTLVLADRIAFPLIHEREIVGSLGKITANMIPPMDHLTSLSLLRCCVSPDQLGLLLNKMPRLRTLCITASNAFHFKERWTSSALIAAITSSVAAHSLTSLTIQADRGNMLCRWLNSLRALTNLQHLTIDATILLSLSDQDPDDDEDGYDSDDRPQLTLLHLLLPSSIETVTFCCRSEPKHIANVNELLRNVDVVETKSWLPFLRRVDLQIELRSTGLQLCVDVLVHYAVWDLGGSIRYVQ